MDKDKNESIARKQYFSRIQSIKAVDGSIIVNVKNVEDASYKGAPLQNQSWTLKVAAERAHNLNDTIHLYPKEDRETLFSIMDDLLAAMREAKKQIEEGKAPHLEQLPPEKIREMKKGLEKYTEKPEDKKE